MLLRIFAYRTIDSTLYMSMLIQTVITFKYVKSWKTKKEITPDMIAEIIKIGIQTVGRFDQINSL